MLLITVSLLYWDVFISLVGLAFFIYGKKRPDVVAIVAGMIMMVYPYFIHSLKWSLVLAFVIISTYMFLTRVVRL